MTLERFIQLWTHRYHKYTHIFKANCLGYAAWLRFLILKMRLPAGRKLVAIIRTEHFGDIVAAEPISRYVRSLHPDDHIVWFVKPVFEELVKYNPHIDEAFREFCVTERKVLMKTGVFDQVYELQFRNNNHCPKCQVFIENPVALRRGINVDNYLNFGNLLEIFSQSADLIPPKGHFPADDQPRLYYPKGFALNANTLKLERNFITVHCQSNFAPKDWPPAEWEKLISWLAERTGYQIVEVGLKSNLSVSTDSYLNLCGKLTILETASVIGQARYHIGLDSGPSHLASASGTFGIILMGALNEFAEYNPYSGRYGRGENIKLIRKRGLLCSEMPFEYVRDEISKVFEAGEK